MIVPIWICATALVPMALGIAVDHVPNQCPPVPEEYPLFYGHPDDCQYYFMCDFGQPKLQQCAPGTRWSVVFKTCVGYNTHFDTCTRENAVRECLKGETDFIPHPSACQRYYNCSKPPPPTGPPFRIQYLEQFEDECPYPQAFDVLAKECRPYTQAYCGPYRWLAKDPCDYVNNKCSRIAHCIPCESRIPSCVGLSDGRHPLSQFYSRAYIQCEDERNVGPGRYFCSRHAQTNSDTRFSPIKQDCVPEWEIPRDQGGLAPSCDGKAPGQSYRTDDRPDVYYSCPDAQVFYCGLGNVFNESSQQCESA